MFIDYCVELVIKGRKQYFHIIFSATKDAIPVNIGKIIIEANSREFWVVAKFNSFTFVFLSIADFYDTNLWKMLANIRNNITTSKNFVWVINENVINKGGWGSENSCRLINCWNETTALYRCNKKLWLKWDVSHLSRSMLKSPIIYMALLVIARGPARGGSHVARLNLKTSRVGVY